ncbi:S9 family peptidase [Amycolatopsis sp. 195334CR]|uniref:alpha/beta hydrolase family protein n=1 Tax=Amycolatopsis sp. 195334CR TaxID=2814588 RepID=UPI001A8D420A|nr:prolyl oligopeptidase family serine peptidase [Amycolatopsis sp. 195334CR]MBN6033680.1 prolyl oligopeptidase family serine peptidase [Amycolatopsis sp. 195334CR]
MRQVRRATALIAAVAALSASCLVPAAQAGQPVRFGSAEVSFTSASKTMHGSVVAPAPEGGRRPGMVLVHGSGEGNREELRKQAEAFAAQGVVSLIYDKDTTNYSLLERDFSGLADDAVAALDYLRTRPEVDPERVGLWGFSEGGWVSPLAATRTEHAAFLVVVGANGVSPAEAQAWSYRQWMRKQGVTAESVLDLASSTATRVAAEAGLFPEATFDPAPALEKLRVPVLAIWGAQDRQSPPRDAATLFADTQADNPAFTMRTFPAAHHGLGHTTDGFDRLEGFVPGYPELVGSWVNGITGGAAASASDPLPAQDETAAELTPLAWYESLWVQGFALLALLVAFAAYPIAALVGSLRRRREDPVAAAPAHGAAITGLLAVIGALTFVMLILTGGGEAVGPVLWGRPVIWLAAQLLAVGTLVLAGIAAVRWRRAGPGRDGRRSLGLLLGGAVLLVPWGLYWGLFLP